MIRKAFFTSLLILTMATVVHAQQTPPTPPTPAPALTELEQTKLENLQLKQAIIQQSPQFQAYQRDLQAFRQLVATDHPGFTWDDTAGGIVRDPNYKPSAPVPAKK